MPEDEGSPRLPAAPHDPIEGIEGKIAADDGVRVETLDAGGKARPNLGFLEAPAHERVFRERSADRHCSDVERRGIIRCEPEPALGRLEFSEMEMEDGMPAAGKLTARAAGYISSRMRRFALGIASF